MSGRGDELEWVAGELAGSVVMEFSCSWEGGRGGIWEKKRGSEMGEVGFVCAWAALPLSCFLRFCWECCRRERPDGFYNVAGLELGGW